jgi:hypothetical protein
MQRVITCEYLNGKTCDWISNKIGKSVATNSGFCHHVCGRLGPNSKKEFIPERFLAEAFVTQYAPLPFADRFVKKVRNSYKREGTIRIPMEWYLIRKELYHLVESGKIKGILLTGSLIVGEVSGHKDYDIILVIERLSEMESLKKELPVEINNKICDYYFCEKAGNDLFFISLDCENKKLYTSFWFEPKLKEIMDNIELISPPEDSKKVIEIVEEIALKRFKIDLAV